MIVADTTLIVYLLVDGPSTSAARQVYSRDRIWIAPALWRPEFVNTMATHIRAAKFGIDEAFAKITVADRIMNTSIERIDDRAILEMSVANNHATYDCVFVWFARHRGLRVVSGDKKMVSKYPDVAVGVQDFADGK